MNVQCPSCGAGMDLDVLLAHEDSRAALAKLAAMSLPLGKLTMQYIRLFKPATRQMSHSRTVALIEELLPDLKRGAFTRAGREWAAPIESWKLAMERVLEQRDNGKLTLPLKSHGYLLEVLMGMADKVEGQAEREAEAERRSRSGAYSTGGVLEALAVPSLVGEVPSEATAPPLRYTGPSKAALKIQAQIAAAKQRREGGPTTDGGDAP